MAANPTIGPLYRDGDLNIRSSVEGAYLTLNGTIYATGDITIGASDKNFTLDLNGQAMFAEGSLTIGGKCTVIGSGAIIALGNIVTLPSVSNTSDDYIAILSVEGSVTFQPSGDFYGSISGAAGVDVSPNTCITQSSGEFPLGFPGTVDPEILTYTIVD